MPTVMCDNLAWSSRPGGMKIRAFGTPDKWCVAAVTGDGWQLDGPAPVAPDVIYQPRQLSRRVPEQMVGGLAMVGDVVRWRSPDLWEALVPAIIQQHVMYDHARRFYSRFRFAYGPRVHSRRYGDVYLVPDARTVSRLNKAQIDEVGLGMKRSKLLAAAACYIEYGAKWAVMEPADLVADLADTPGLNPWIAGAAVADYTHDWSLYPVNHATFRKYAEALSPPATWPEYGAEFAQAWRLAGGQQIGALTMLTLAWGLSRRPPISPAPPRSASEHRGTSGVAQSSD
jgi:DNA-3-methyladenine glycosylase II